MKMRFFSNIFYFTLYILYESKRSLGFSRAVLSLRLYRSIKCNTGELDNDLESFLKGSVNKPWGGTRDILKRKGQIPLASLGPRDIIKICLAALQHNDDPQLDHGGAVVLEFKSPNGVIAESGLDPAGYGRFLRSTAYSALLDFSSVELLGDLEEIAGGDSVRQSVKIKQFDSPGKFFEHTFDFYLSKVNGLWLLDSILKKK